MPGCTDRYTRAVNDVARTVVAVAIVVLVSLLALRLLVSIPEWIRRGRGPETRGARVVGGGGGGRNRFRRARRPETRVVRVIGVGGGGSNAVDRMVAARIWGVSFVACNTDAQALRHATARTKVRIGDATTRGLGSGGDPEVGRQSAEENETRIARAVAGADLVFISAGLGGGTGSGAAPFVGASAQVQGALTIAVVTTPFAFEGAQRRRIADTALAELAANVDAIITIPNERVAGVVTDDTSMLDAFRVVDDVVVQAVRGIIDLLRSPALINVDFADVRAVICGGGPAFIGLGRGSGENRAIEAARRAIASPLLEGSIQGARRILFNVSGPANLRLREVLVAADEIRANADPDANVIFGASLNRKADEEVLITLIATGLDWPIGADMGTRDTEQETAEPGIVEELEPTMEPVEAGVPATEPVEAGVPASGRRTPPPKVATMPGPDASPPDARAVDAPPTSGEGRSARAPTHTEVDLDVPTFLRRGRTP